jgi:PAS domain S-box-containing protein
MNSFRPSASKRYLVALVAVVAAILATSQIPLLRERLTFFAFWPLIFLASWLGGVGPGLMTTALSALAVLYFLSPSGSLLASGGDVRLTLGVFLVAGAFGALVARWRERSERAVRASNERFQSLADSAPVLIWMAGVDGKCAYVNRSWLRFTGGSVEQQLGDGWMDALHLEDRERAQTVYREAFAARRPFEMGYRLRREDGEYREVMDRGMPRFDASGAFVGFVRSIVDVSEQRAALREAEEARRYAEAASRAKDAFLATVSHELRTPLSPILSWAGLLRGGGLSEEQRNRAAEVIERSARTQAQLVEDLLDVSRIVAGKLRLHVQPVALAGIVESAVETIRPAAAARSIRLQVVLDSAPAYVAGDPDRLQQIVWNLLSNAVKFTPKGGRVHVVLERVNSHVEITISDTGQGIPTESLPHLFERFWQADPSTSRRHGGLGLGLAIVRHLAELHGGTVTADSAGEAQGSTFTLKLPLLPLLRGAGEEEARRHPTIRDSRAAPSPIRLDGLRVLVVDDEMDSTEVVRVLLQQCGAEVRIASSAVEALETLDQWIPDVLVSDIGMPGEDGYALLARVRRRSDSAQGLPVVALTAFAAIEDRVKLLSAGFQLHVAKPADPEELTTAIAAAARMHPRA